MTEEQLRAILTKAYGLGAKNAHLWMRRKPGCGPQLQDISKMDREREEDLAPLVVAAIDEMKADTSCRHNLSPADSIPHRPCKSCGGTQIGEQDGNRIISRCVQCRAREEE